MRKIPTIFLLFFYLINVQAAAERIWLNAKVNGQLIRFAFDTGAAFGPTLFSTTAKKLGLKVTPPDPNFKPGPGKTAFGITELCNLDNSMTNVRTSLAVLEMPTFLKPAEDGIWGWPGSSNSVISLDSAADKVDFLPDVPAETTNWLQFHIQTIAGDLALIMREEKNVKAVVGVDTGSDSGIDLNPKKWRVWKASHTNQPTTMEGYYTPNPGFVAAEGSWADGITLDSLTLTDVPVMEANSGDTARFSSAHTIYEATLGLVALKRLDIIIDGKHGIAYLRLKTTPPLPREHNRIGAAFIPQDMQSNDLVAHVADGSPAYEAGIRNNDVLLKIGELDTTKWRTDPNVLPLSRFFHSPAGTKLELTLKRGDKVFQTTAILRNILPPDAAKIPIKI